MLLLLVPGSRWFGRGEWQHPSRRPNHRRQRGQPGRGQTRRGRSCTQNHGGQRQTQATKIQTGHSLATSSYGAEDYFQNINT